MQPDAPAEPTHFDHLRNPAAIPLELLQELTAYHYQMSAAFVDQPNSNHHRWYYCFAMECERRGLSLDDVVNR
jgi:hypothetical protein